MIVPAVEGCNRQLTREPPELAMVPKAVGTGVPGIAVGVGVDDPGSSSRYASDTQPSRLPQVTGYQPFDSAPRTANRVPSGSETMIPPVVDGVVRHRRFAPPVLATTPNPPGAWVDATVAVGDGEGVGDGVIVGDGVGLGVGVTVGVGLAEGVPQTSTSAR